MYPAATPLDSHWINGPITTMVSGTSAARQISGVNKVFCGYRMISDFQKFCRSMNLNSVLGKPLFHVFCWSCFSIFHNLRKHFYNGYLFTLLTEHIGSFSSYETAADDYNTIVRLCFSKEYIMSSYDKMLICTLNRRNKRSASGCDDDRIRFIEFDQFCIGGCIQKDLYMHFLQHTLLPAQKRSKLAFSDRNRCGNPLSAQSVIFFDQSDFMSL